MLEGKTLDPIVDFWLIIYKNTSLLPTLLPPLRETKVPSQITILDNSCDPRISEEIRSLLLPGEVLHVSKTNLMCCGGSQFLLEHTSAPYIAYMCANHTEIHDPSWIEDALEVLQENPDTALCGHLMRVPGLFYYRAHYGRGKYPDIVFPEFLPKLEGTFSRELIYELADLTQHVQGGIWVAKRAALDMIGGFETALPHLFMDVELDTRLQCYGWKLAHCPGVFSAHAVSVKMPYYKDFKLSHVYEMTNK
jgi:GT2 family glycosyltransferase